MNKKILVALSISTVIIISVVTSVLIYYEPCTDCNNEPSNTENGNGTKTNVTDIWDSIYFTLINNTVFRVKNYVGTTLVIEFSKSDCSECTSQKSELSKLQDYINTNNLNVTILTLMVDLDTPKELLTYCIDNNISWSIGSINEDNYSKINIEWVPTFLLFNTTSQQIGKHIGIMVFEELLTFVNLSSYMGSIEKYI